jgi:hypothetical protein
MSNICSAHYFIKYLVTDIDKMDERIIGHRHTCISFR